MDEEIRKLILEVLQRVARGPLTSQELSQSEHQLQILRSQLSE